MYRYRRLKRPVISRLTWAWLGAFCGLLVLSGVFFRAMNSGEGASRIAMPIDQMENFARAPAHSGGPALRDGGPSDEIAAKPFDKDDKDGLVLIYPDENEMFASNDDTDFLGDEDYLSDDYSDDEYSGDDIVITIPGQGNRAADARAASLTPAVRAIADPDPALLQTTALGKTPRVAPDGRKSVPVYARSFDGDRAKPRLAIIVGGLGLNTAITEQAIDNLPPEISLSFAPYAKNLEFWTRKARLAGHEVLIELPMEGYGGNNQALGAAALLSSRSPEENLQRMDWLMSRFGGYFAATNYMGAKFSADEASLAPVLQKLKDAGVGYIDDTGAAKRTGESLGVPMATISRMIPAAADENDRGMVQRELANLVQIAERDGVAIGKTYAYAATIDEIASWSRSLESKGIAQAPASALLRTATAAR